MDGMIDKLKATAIEPNKPDNQTNFESLYKNWGKLNNQEERRQKLLEVQKKNRNNTLDDFRGILDTVQEDQNNKYFGKENTAYYRPQIYVAGFNKTSAYGKVLMLSEWMVEKPTDFEENWLVVPCPKGSRVIVVASNGITKLFNKRGRFIFDCKTALPGGSSQDTKRKINSCILDCFYQKSSKTLYVLDVLSWKSQPMTNGELEFRDYWLKSQFTELNGIFTHSEQNELIFSILPKVSCEAESFKEFMQQVHFKTCKGEPNPDLDGLLFYHKKAFYFSGETPLVGWLYPFMVPEVLGNDIIVNPCYMLQKPANYTNQADYIIEFTAQLDKKKNRRNRRTSEMDTSDTKSEDLQLDSKSKNESNTESMEAEAVSNSNDQKKSDVEPIDDTHLLTKNPISDLGTNE